MTDNRSLTIDFETGPVTALSIISENLVLAGICGNLHVYDINKQELIHIEYDLLNKQKIHGIKKDNKDRQDRSSIQVIIYGGKGLQILTVIETKGQFTGLSKLNSYEEFNDWIWDVVRLESSTIAMVTAHNVILLFDWSAQSILHQVICVEKCILYSAHFIGTEWNNLILAAGTVFNQIVLWSPTGQADSQGHQKVIHRLEGHQGVIFSISYHKEYQLLATASDDRSIRLWKFQFESQPKTASEWMTMSSAPLHTLYGHSARVWSVHLLHDSIISVGEDSTCCVWNYNGEVLNRFQGHKGKSIWSIDCKNDIIVTGGGDNSIRLWKINNTVSSANNQQLLLSVSEDFKKSKEDIPRSVILKNYDTAIVMTNSGSLCQYDINKKAWKLLYHNASFKSYSLLVTSPDDNLTAVGNIEGDILMVLNDEYICKRYFNGKVYGLIWIDSVHLLTTGPDGQIFLLEVQYDDKNSEGLIRVNIKGEFILPACKQRWVSAGLIVSDDNDDDTVLVCGDRGGTVHHYRQSVSKTPIQSFPKIHGKAGVTSIIYRDNKIYTGGRDGQYRIWSLDTDNIQLLNSHKVLKNLEWIDRLVLTGNNQLHVYGFHSTNFVIWSEVDNQLLLEIKCGGGHRSWDCKVNADDIVRFLYIKNGDVILHNTSLLSNQIVLKPALHGREVCDVKYIESISNNGDLYHLIITTSEDTDIIISQLKVSKEKPSELCPLQTLQGHLSSVRTVTLNDLPSTSDRRQYLLFTGGGRAQIEIWKLSVCDNADSMVCFNVEFEHVSSCFLGNLENKKVLKPWKKKHVNPDPETRILCLTSFCAMNIDKAYPASVHFVTAACSDGFVRLFCFNVETKTMELLEQSDFHNNCVLKTHHFIHKSPSGTQIFLLSGATEGVVAFWNVTKQCLDVMNLYKPNCDTMNCNQAEPNSKCDPISSDTESDDISSDTSITSKNLCFPTKTKHINVKNENLSEADVKDWQPSFKLKCHQSGINSMDTYKKDENKYMIASGGDDNCLSVNIVSLDNTGNFALVKSAQNINAHSAQITGLRIVSEDMIVTVSVDQRLNLWQLKVSTSSKDIQIDYIDCRFINISDIANLDIRLDSSKRRLYYSVCGVGLACGEIVIPFNQPTS